MKPQRRQREEGDDDGVLPYDSTLLDDDESSTSPLQSASTVEEFIEALQEIDDNDDLCDRSEENVSIILTSKIQLIVNNRTNQDLLQALGEFFMWMMPYTESLTGAEREFEDEERELGQTICSRKDFEELFVRHLLPFAKSFGAIYSLCRSVCLISSIGDNTYFVTAVARDQLLKLVKIAPCEKSLRWALQAIYMLANIKKDGVSIEWNPFICDEVATIAYKLLCESTESDIIEQAADILAIQVEHSTPQCCTTDPAFAQKMLRKLDEATEPATIGAIAHLVDEVIDKKQININIFGSSEAARVFLSKLNSSDDPELLREVCIFINIVGCNCDEVSDDFVSPEMCRAIFNCFPKQKNESFKNDVMDCIAVLTSFVPRVRSTFAQECPGLSQVLIATLTTATDDDTRRAVATVVANIALDAESAKLLFNNVAIYEALIHAASWTQNEKTKTKISFAMRNASDNCTDFLPMCAARYPFYDEKRIQLLKLDSLDSLFLHLNNSGWFVSGSVSAIFLKFRSVLIILEKFDQFLEVVDQRIEADDKRIELMLLKIAKGFVFIEQRCWEPLFGDPFFDVTLSLLERSSGGANAVFVKVIYDLAMAKPLITVQPSTVLRLLQKLDNSKELRDREYNRLKMEFDIYNILEAATLRNPELFRDNNFLVDNSVLIRSCFQRSFEIHEFDTKARCKKRLTSLVESLYNFDPRMKEKVEFNY